MKPFRERAERHFVEPELTIPTEEERTVESEGDVQIPKYDARVQSEAIRQWVNKTGPIKQPFEQQPSKSVWSEDTYAPHADSKFSPTACDSESLCEEWQRRAFDRTYASIAQKYEFQQTDENYEACKINEKIDRYKKAFLKGFYEARIRRIERNAWLYEKLHVNPEHIKDKFRRLMYSSKTQFVAADNKSIVPEKNCDHDENLQTEDHNQESVTQLTTEDNVDVESVYSFVPERDNVMLQDENAPPQIRGFGFDKLNNYDPTIKLLSLDNWVPADVQDWLNERRLENLKSWEERSEKASSIDEPDRNVYNNNVDWKYEQIPGMNADLPQWLGPKKLDENEIDLEHFQKGEEVVVNAKAQTEAEEHKVNKPDKEQPDDESVCTVESESSPAYLLRQLIQSQSQDYYRLWYSTHDMFNTTPFLEARLQRLLREVLGKRGWNLYSSYLKRKSQRTTKPERKPSTTVQSCTSLQ